MNVALLADSAAKVCIQPVQKLCMSILIQAEQGLDIAEHCLNSTARCVATSLERPTRECDCWKW